MTTTQDPAELLAALQRKTSFVDRAARPGWSFELAPILLEQNVQPGQVDPWTPEQRQQGVTLDFVHLTLKEHHRAEGRAGQRFALYGGTSQGSPQVMYEERARLALASVDGKPVPENDDERDAVWHALGKLGRQLCCARYIVATGEGEGEDDANGKALREAADRVAASFRVRV
jgi:hypothetical protein